MPEFSKKFRHTLFASLGCALLAGFAPLACSSDTGVDTGALPGSGGTGRGGSGNGTGGSANNGSGGTGNNGSGGTIFVPTDGGPTTDASDGAVADADACLEANVDFSSEPPNVLLLVDRSGSMSGTIQMGGGGASRWASVRTALLDPTAGIVPQLASQVNLGLALYTGPDRGSVGNMDSVGGADPDYIETDMCPYLVTEPIALNNYAAIDARYRPLEITTGSLGQTPTGESIEAVVPTLTALDPVLFPGRKVIVLATDGEPDLCSNGDDEMGGRTRSVAAVTAAFDAGITVFVISVGSDVGEQHLRQLANLGQGFPANDMTDRFYRATDAAQLAQAFEDIVNGVRDCIFALDGRVMGAGTDGTVTVDGMVLTVNDPNGWRLNSESEVELLGTACEGVKEGTHEIGISFPCGVFIDDPR